MKRSLVLFAACALVFGLAVGCKKEAAKPAAPASQAAPMAAPMAAPAPGAPAAPAPAEGGLSGKVIETMNAGGYTYVLLENNGQKTWVAGPMTQVKVGQHVTCQPGAVMKNFTSPTLKRTFDSIVFSGGIR